MKACSGVCTCELHQELQKHVLFTQIFSTPSKFQALALVQCSTLQIHVVSAGVARIEC